MSSYPGSAKIFTTKSDGPGNTILAAHINDLQLEVTAIEQDLIAGLPVARGGTGATTAAWSVDTLTFPATQVPSTNVNTLDDYEEGSWTPVIGGAGGTSGQTYSTAVGTYVKIGKLVIASFSVILSGKGTITSSLQIQGLPFTAGSEGDMMMRYWVNLASNVIHMSGLVVSGTTTATVYINTAASAELTATDTTIIGNTTGLRGVCVYQASA